MRYFTIAYIGDHTNGRKAAGSASFDAEFYPTYDEIKRFLKDNAGMTDFVTVTFIQELTKEDFNSAKGIRNPAKGFKIPDFVKGMLIAYAAMMAMLIVMKLLS